jgi:hypothetical protein
MGENVSRVRFNLGLVSKCLVIFSGTTLPALVLLLILYLTRLPYHDPNAFYSSLSVTKILIPATFTSTFAVLATGDALTLTSFASAWHWLRPRKDHTLPSPQEVRTASSITSKPEISSVFSFWKLLFGRWRPKGKDHKTRQVSTVLLFPGLIASLVLFLGLSISACDYWIHSAASSVSISIAQSGKADHSLPTPARNASMTWNKSMDAFYSYTVNGSIVQVSSNLDVFHNDSETLLNEFNNYDTIQSVSQQLYFNQSDYAIYNVDNRYAFIGSRPFQENLTISARSMAVQTSCYDMTQLCQFEFDNNLWTCSAGSTPFTLPDSDDSATYTSAFPVLINATSGQVIPYGSGLNPMAYAFAFADIWYFCQTTVGYMNYSLSGGMSFSTKFDPLPNNAPEAWQVSGVLAAWNANLDLVSSITSTAINVESLLNSDMLSVAMSAILLSFVAGVLDSNPADSWSVNTLAARIPIAPVAVFTSLCALYGLLGIALTALAFGLAKKQTIKQDRADMRTVGGMLRKPEKFMEHIMNQEWTIEKEESEDGEVVVVLVLPHSRIPLVKDSKHGFGSRTPVTADHKHSDVSIKPFCGLDDVMTRVPRRRSTA